MKGVDQPVDVVTVAALIEAHPSSDATPRRSLSRAEVPVELDSAVPLVCRERELRRLRWLRRRAALGQRQSCLICGATGIGKTRLASELADEVAEIGWTTTYIQGATPGELNLYLLAAAAETLGPALVVVDDLDASPPAVIDRIEDMLEPPLEQSALIVATAREPSVRLERVFARGGGTRLDLPPLDERGISEVAALYTRGTDLHVPLEVLDPAGGVPALLHRIVSEWVTDRASQLVGDATRSAAGGRPELLVAEADVAGRVTDLELTRERSHLYLHRPHAVEIVCPFKGLASYQPEDAEYFFGREQLVAELIARVVGASFLGVVGPSGSGKSSVVRAGLVPALASGVLPHSDHWPLAVMRPGDHPMRALDEALGNVRQHGRGRQVVVVDQFEEVFTTCVDEEERREFASALSRRAADTTLIVAAVRSDYYGRCAAYPDLARLFGSNHVLVGPMNSDELRRAIELPARRANLSVEPELTEALVRDVVDQPGALPLLSTKLLELWQLREARTLSLARYRETGGVEAAVAGLAEAAYSRLSEDQQELARTILLRLAIVDEDGTLVRRRARLDEFETTTDSDAEVVLRVLTDARLLTTSAGYLEVAHEALLREWPRLRDWLREDAEGTQLHHHLIQAARDWEERGRDRGELYRGARLSAALDWTGSRDPALNQLERDFLASSREAHLRELRRLRALLAGALVLVVVALIAGVIAYVQRGSAQRAAGTADAQRLGTEAQLQRHLDLALLLSHAAVNLDNSPATQSDLIATLLRAPAALTIRHLQGLAEYPVPMWISPDGQTLAVGNTAGRVLFLDARTLDTERSVLPPGGASAPPTAVAYSPNGIVVAVAQGGSQGRVVLLNAQSGRPVGRLGPEPNVQTLAFSPDGHTLAVGFFKPTSRGCGLGAYAVTQFNIATGRRLSPITNVASPQPCPDSIDKLFYSPSGTQLLATDRGGGKPGRGRIFVLRASDLTTERVYRVTGVTSAALSPDGRTLAVTTDTGSLSFLSYPQGSVRFTEPKAGGAWAIQYTPNGKSLLTSTDNQTAEAWDARSGRNVQTFAGHTDTVTNQAISADGQRLYTASPDGTVIEYDLAGQTSPIRQTLRFSPAYPAVIYANPQATALAISRNGQMVAASPGTGEAEVWNLRTLRPVMPALHGFREFDTVFSPGGAQDLAFSPNGKLLAAGGNNGSTVIVWNMQNGQVVHRFRQPVATACRRHPLDTVCPAGAGLAFSPNGQRLASGDAASRVLLLNLSSHHQTTVPLEKGDFAQSISFGADPNHLIVTTNPNGRGMIWDLAQHHPIFTFQADHSPTYGPADIGVSRDGSTFAYGSSNTVVLRSTTNGQEIGRPIPIPSGYQGVIALSPDAGTVALIAGDGVELWDTKTGSQIGASLPGAPTQPNNPGGPGDLAFTPDGHRLAIISPTGLITFWNTSPAAWDRQACRVAGRGLSQAEWHEYVPNRAYQPVCS